MTPYGATLHLNVLRDANQQWVEANRKHQEDVEALLWRLIPEAIVARMSINQVADAAGITTRKVRRYLHEMGVDTRHGKGLMAHQAAEVLANNAELLGVRPQDVDLMSPLMYLPAGESLRKKVMEGVDEAD